MNRSDARTVSGPPPHLYKGEIGEELVVLSNSEVRVAERAEQETSCLTADGQVGVRPGDFIVSMPDGERFPIKAEIYFGTYEVLSRVGAWYVGRRLLHPRRAWPIISPGAEFDYGPDRGVVSAAKGGWIYQSADDDFGLINVNAQAKSYVVVGSAKQLQRADWTERFGYTAIVFTGLPVVLTALALLALQTSASHPLLAKILLAIEAALLVASAATVWMADRNRWSLRAATSSGLDVARRFQVAVEALGLPTSSVFPTMTLWRAAQDDSSGAGEIGLQHIGVINQLIDETHEQVRQTFRQHEALEHRVDRLPWVAAFAVLFCLGLVAAFDSQGAKLVAVWLPSVVGAAHAWAWKRQSVRRASAAADLARELRFVRSRLVSLAPRGVPNEVDPQRRAEVISTLRMLCRCIAHHTQRELQLTSGEKMNVPV